MCGGGGGGNPVTNLLGANVFGGNTLRGTFSPPTVTPNIPAVPDAPPAPIDSTSAEISDASKAAKTNQQKKIKAYLGRKSTILTGPQGIQDDAKTASKTLLGQ